MTLSPTLSEVLDAATDDALSGVFTALPGIVESYDVATQTAAVQPAVKNAFVEEGGVHVVEPLPLLTSVPVLFPGASDVSITWPLKRGDAVLLVFCAREIGTWHASGQVSAPLTDQRHHLTDAIAIPGLRSSKGRIANAATSGITLAAPAVRLGAHDANDPIVRKSDLQAVVDYIKTHTHPAPGGTTSAPSPSPSAATGSPVVTSK